MSDQGHWWPGGREGSSSPQNPGGQGGTVPPTGAGPYGGGAYYYPPGTTPGSRQTNGAPRPAQHRPMNPRAGLWLVIGVGVVALLLHTHRIGRIDVILFCTIVPSIILHEVAHGWVALAFGDDTAKRAGRLTLNPLKHIDIIGTIVIPLLTIWGGYGFFGYAKPVPVNVSKLRSPRNHGVLVSLAGPMVNVVLAVLAAVLFHLFGAANAASASAQVPTWVLILFYLGLVNVWLTVFNMIPIPPLDGSVLVERMLPASWWPRYLHLRRYTMPFVLILVVLLTIIPDGNTSLLGHFQESTVNWWASVLGLG